MRAPIKAVAAATPRRIIRRESRAALPIGVPGRPAVVKLGGGNGTKRITLVTKTDDSQTRAATAAPKALSPAQIADNLDRALENFLADHPDITREEALEMWRAAGG
jgi:hypothetical protein